MLLNVLFVLRLVEFIMLVAVLMSMLRDVCV